jgi:hypothetical protein
MLHQSGWLVDPADTPFYAATSDAVPTSALTGHRCLVLLGEPGMGKSSALAAHGRHAVIAYIQPNVAAPVGRCCAAGRLLTL